MRRKISKIVICFLAAGTLATTAYIFFSKTKLAVVEDEPETKTEAIVEISPDKIQEAGIETQQAASGYLQQIIHAPAHIILNGNTVVHLAPKIVGTVVETRRNVGDYVAQNEVLAVLDSRGMADAKSDFLHAFKQLNLSMNKLERDKNLYDRHIIAEQEYLNSLTEAQQAHIQRDRTQQKLLSLGMHYQEIDNLPSLDSEGLSRYELRSPIEGVVMQKEISHGDIMGEDQEAFVVGNPSLLWIEMMVFPKDLHFIHQGLVAELVCPKGDIHQARIISISPIIDERTRASRVIAELDNYNREWRPGMFVCTKIKGDLQPTSLVVPKEAVQKINGQTCLFICNKEGFEVRPIQTGRHDDVSYEVVSGLSPGEIYASKNTFLLKAEQGKDEVHED